MKVQTLARKQPGPQKCVPVHAVVAQEQCCAPALCPPSPLFAFPSCTSFSKGSAKRQGACCGRISFFSQTLMATDATTEMYLACQSCSNLLHSQTAACRQAIPAQRALRTRKHPWLYQHQHPTSLERGYFGILDSLRVVKPNGSSVVSFTLSCENF